VLGRGDTEAAAAKDAALRAPKQVLAPLAAGIYVDGAYTYGGLRAEVESAGEARADAGILGGSGGWRVPVATRALSHPSIKGAGEVWMQPGTLVC
jgi:hypothetical protein